MVRVGEAIRETVATSLLSEVADPRINGVTVLRAEVSGDLRNATVFVTVMGTESQQRLSMRALRHAAGYLQAKVAARLQTRFTPVLSFKLDEGVKRSVELSRLIDETREADLANGRSLDEPPPPIGEDDEVS